MFGDDGGQVVAFDCGDDCADMVLWVEAMLLARVAGLDAASILLMKMPPLPSLGSIMHWMSQKNVPSLRRILYNLLQMEQQSHDSLLKNAKNQQQPLVFVLLPITFSFFSTTFSLTCTPYFPISVRLVPAYSDVGLGWDSSYYFAGSSLMGSFFQRCRTKLLAVFSSVQSMSLKNSSSMLVPVLADIQKQCSPSFSAFSLPSSGLISRQSRSILLPNRNTKLYPPLFQLKRFSHISVQLSEFLEVTSKTIIAQCASFRQLGISDLNLYCPAVSHNCSRQPFAL